MTNGADGSRALIVPLPLSRTRAVVAAAHRYEQARGEAVADAIGTRDLRMVELFLIIVGYLNGAKTLTSPVKH